MDLYVNSFYMVISIHRHSYHNKSNFDKDFHTIKSSVLGTLVFIIDFSYYIFSFVIFMLRVYGWGFIMKHMYLLQGLNF